MSCNVLITSNETHPHDTLPVYRPADLNGDHRHKETSTAMLPPGDGYSGISVSGETIERGSKANVRMTVICVALKEK